MFPAIVSRTGALALAIGVALAGVSTRAASADEPFLSPTPAPGRSPLATTVEPSPPPPAKLASSTETAAKAAPAVVEPYERIRLFTERPLLWFDQAGASKQAWAMLGRLDDAASDGLHRADYRPAALAESIRMLAEVRPVAEDPRFIALDRQLTESALRYVRHLRLGRVDPARAHRDVTLPPRDFDAAALLAEALKSGRIDELHRLAAPPHPMYDRLRKALADYRALATSASPPPPLPSLPARGKVEPGDRWEGAAALGQLLFALGDLPSYAVVDDVYAPALAEAVRRFQRRHGLDDDGIVGRQTHAELLVPATTRLAQLELALERFRWLPVIDDDSYVAINIPAFRLWATRRDGEQSTTWDARVVVGKATESRTPIFVGSMRWIEFNPYWNVPLSIARREIVPKLRTDPDYLARESMEILGPGEIRSAVATPELIEGVRAGTHRLRQNPGELNALGRVKFVLPNRMAIYLHDTPSRQLFRRARRDFSHGCIRVEGPESLAEFLLADSGKWPLASIERAIDSKQRTIANLRRPVPVVIFYVTATADADGRVSFHPDVYGYDRDALAALAAARGNPAIKGT